MNLQSQLVVFFTQGTDIILAQVQTSFLKKWHKKLCCVVTVTLQSLIKLKLVSITALDTNYIYEYNIINNISQI